MGKLFKKGDKIIKVDHARVIFRLLSWFLDQEVTRKIVWKVESENHVDFCVEQIALYQDNLVLGMVSLKGMDELFWGKNFDVHDWVERLEMVAEVRGIYKHKLFKIGMLNLREKSKEW